MKAFVAGATGYVGGAVVELLCAGDDSVVAHIRPDSSSLAEQRERFEALGATVDTSAWDEDAMAEAIEQHAVDVVFCCIGTTKKRMRESDNPEQHDYEAVDYGLTALLVRACLQAGTRPRFVYISAAGTGPNALGSYMQARYKAEQYIQHAEIPYVIARPGFITGDDREESRPLERGAAVVSDALLEVAGAIGFTGLRDKWQSLNAEQLATALIDLARDPAAEDTIAETGELRRRSG